MSSPSKKTRTAERLSAASNRSTEKVRSDELDALKQKYADFTTRFAPFKLALKSYHQSLINLEHNRSELLEQIEALSQGTPLFDTAARGNQVIVAAPTWAKTYASKKDLSYCGMERQMSALNQQYITQFEEYCLEYLNEWEIVVSTRIKTSIDKSMELRKTYDHYKDKVEKLEDIETKTTDKGKQLNQKAKDKLTRNQTKLTTAKEEYDKVITCRVECLCVWLCFWFSVFRN